MLNIKLILILSLAISGVGYVSFLHIQNSRTEAQLQLEVERSDLLKQKLSTVEQVNIKNAQELQLLKDDKDRAIKLVSTLKDNIINNNNVLNNINKNTTKLDDGDLAPVLRQTIAQIQKIRSDRQAASLEQ